MVSVALLVAAGPERSRFDPEGEIWPEKGLGRLERLRTAVVGHSRRCAVCLDVDALPGATARQ